MKEKSLWGSSKHWAGCVMAALMLQRCSSLTAGPNWEAVSLYYSLPLRPGEQVASNLLARSSRRLAGEGIAWQTSKKSKV